ncbi:hypothetical protein [Rhizobium leguminosarum]|nr:hypothetical protein [Rhizobium leguminosarum]MBY5318190.1 hypothetical protein [Rhizobium leguminosarum]
MKRREKQEYDGWLRANASEPDYKKKTGWRRVVWRIAHFFDGWYSI